MFSRLATLFVFVWSALFAAAQITIIAPSANYWWIENSQNLYSWTCGSQFNQGYTNFTVLLDNQNRATFAGPIALVAIQYDYDCSVLLQLAVNAPVGTGYLLTFSNVYNETDVIATSQPFEIKAEGSAYAPQPSNAASATVTATASTNGTGTATGAGATNTSSTKSGAMSSKTMTVGLFTAVMALAGAALMM